MNQTSVMAALFYLLFLVLLSLASGKVSLYLSSDQTEALYGIKTPGLYYITEGVVNKYAMNFQHQVTNTIDTCCRPVDLCLRWMERGPPDRLRARAGLTQ